MNSDSSPALTTQRALEQLGSLVLREHSMDTLLQRVVDLTKTVTPGNTEASLLLMAGDKPTAPASTGRLATDCDERQFRSGHGPCMHAATTGTLVEVTDTRIEPRWRDYMTQAAEAGALSSLSVPLSIDQGMTGALNIYAREPNAFDDDSRSAATSFAPYAAVAVANMRAYDGSRVTADNLQRALESRAVIDQAKGILMERYKLTADQAFQVLTQISMHRNEKVRDIAEVLVLTGDHPRLPGRR